MVIAADRVNVDEQVLAQLEAQFMSRGLRVVSSAITGRVVGAADARGPIEGAAKLPVLERALVLAKGANAECVFYLLGLEVGAFDLTRYFVWRPSSSDLVEVDHQTYDAAAPDRRWFVSGPLWRVDGKVIDVDTGAVLAIVGLKHSTPFASDRHWQVDYVDRSLAPQGGYFGWRLVSPDDLDNIRKGIMSRLAIEILGQK
jgi:hypothetical protein